MKGVLIYYYIDTNSIEFSQCYVFANSQCEITSLDLFPAKTSQYEYYSAVYKS